MLFPKKPKSIHPGTQFHQLSEPWPQSQTERLNYFTQFSYEHCTEQSPKLRNKTGWWGPDEAWSV